MGQIGVAITNLPTVIFLKKPFSDGLGRGKGVGLYFIIYLTLNAIFLPGSGRLRSE